MLLKKRIALIQVWFGNIPDYFEYHYRTCVNLDIDFYFFSNIRPSHQYDSPNFHFIPISLREYEKKLSKAAGFPISIDNYYKVTETKPAYADVFYEYVKDYEFVGWYDIDTLFGDINAWFEPYLDDYDVISFGEEHKFYNRIAGPLVIVRNTDALRTVYKADPMFKECMSKEKYSEYDEYHLYHRYQYVDVPIKLFFNSHNCDPISLKNMFDATWSGGKIYVNDEEKLLYHFYRKDHTKFEIRGNSIIASQKVTYLNDFMYVTYFTENYEEMAKGLIRSLEKYSNRKCLLYTVNYTSNLENVLSDQFIVRRINLNDITKGKDFINWKGQAFSVITSKPVIQMDSLGALANKKFVFLDTDIYVTANIDSIAKYFDQLENYPITNSHVHDVLYVIKDNDTENGISPLHSLAEEVGVDITIFPRRKTNVTVYDERSRWFFKEQMQTYYDHKDSSKPEIFRLHDEDTFNVLLSKYNFTKALPVVDIEQEFDLNFKIFDKYTYNMTNPSSGAKLPAIDRDVLVFHGYRKPEEFKKVEEIYGAGILDKTDILLEYDGNTFTFVKNSFLFDKKISDNVRVTIKNGDEQYSAEWKIFEYRSFYISDLYLPNNSVYTVEISESQTDRLIYRYDYLTQY